MDKRFYCKLERIRNGVLFVRKDKNRLEKGTDSKTELGKRSHSRNYVKQ
jgi:hypothetical protein